MEPDLHQRLPHPRGGLDRGAGDRLHPRRRHRLRRGGDRSAGLEVDAFAGRLSFFFNVHNNFLEEIAKFRAARRLWARIMKERFEAKDPRSMMLRFHAQTAGSTLTAQQPDNNVVRVALQALAAVLGGCQSLHTNSRDEALGAAHRGRRPGSRCAPSRSSPTRPGSADIIDPLGRLATRSSALTDELEAKAAGRTSRKIDDMGGMVEAIAQGLPAAGDPGRGLRRADGSRGEGAGRRRGQRVPDLRRPSVRLLKLDPALEEQQVARVRAFRRQRDNAAQPAPSPT